MGNAISPCFLQKGSTAAAVKLVYSDGSTRILSTGNDNKNNDNHNNNIMAGEIMFENPDKVIICHADSFFIGHPLPVLSIDDQLIPGQTYFILPTNRLSFNNNVVSASSLSALTSSHYKPATMIHQCPFQYIKGDNGRVLIKVVPEFITKLLTSRADDDQVDVSSAVHLCTTPELKKHYDRLVGSRNQTWSPKLETISEHNKIRYSPCRFLGLEWKQKEF